MEKDLKIIKNVLLFMGAVLGIYAATRSVVGATMAGSVGYGLGVWLFPG